ncbi:MAG: CPBP family intramembrane metalloprotease, partial [Cyanobacteria bacterium]|nr:CPBP family intramembrane metalloprotease [Cyanobacteriota bacterium]MDW8201604.1 CPBP family intramembrane glutamic endopeptidase [Cyanobacteriota bacterium SKYGB_h_bin112]
IVILVSLLNQQLWQGQGGSNPILPIALDSGDPLAIACFFTTASLAAPLFEEVMFRGFLLPSLTRYLPAWGAIGISSFLFALAHLSVSEVLPLTALGCVLGFVYLRSRSLLAPILLHGLWNGGTLISLVTLGNS